MSGKERNKEVRKLTWETLSALIVLVGFIITIGKIVSANTKALTKLEDSINRLDTTLSEQGSNIHTLDDKVDNHETRISILEHSKGGKEK